MVAVAFLVVLAPLLSLSPCSFPCPSLCPFPFLFPFPYPSLSLSLYLPSPFLLLHHFFHWSEGKKKPSQEEGKGEGRRRDEGGRAFEDEGSENQERECNGSLLFSFSSPLSLLPFPLSSLLDLSFSSLEVGPSLLHLSHEASF